MSQAKATSSIALGAPRIRQIGRKAGQRDDAAEKTRRNESAMARCAQHVLLRRRMDERVNIMTYRRKQAQFPIARPAVQTRPRFFYVRVIVSEAA